MNLAYMPLSLHLTTLPPSPPLALSNWETCSVITSNIIPASAIKRLQNQSNALQEDLTRHGASHKRSPSSNSFLFKPAPSDGSKLDCDSDMVPRGVARMRDGRMCRRLPACGVCPHACPIHSERRRPRRALAQRRDKRRARSDSPSVIPWSTEV